MHSITIEDRTLSYLDIGQGDVLLFGHSFLWDSEMWRPQLDSLSQYYRCIVPDFWGHGQSDFAPDSFVSLADYADHMLALLDHLNIPSVTLVGLSLGGMWAVELAMKAPQRVRGLVLADTFVGLEPEVAHNRYFAMLNTIIANRAIPPVMADALESLFFSHYTLESRSDLLLTFRRYLDQIKGERAQEIARIGKILFDRPDRFDVIEQFALPVLILVGAEDKPRPVLESYLMHDAITGSELVIIPAAGHISCLEQPELFTQAVATFLSSVH